MEKTDLRETVSFKAAVLVILAAAVVFAFILGNVVGTMDISVSDIIDTVSGNHTGTNNKVIWNIRLPRMILAALVGINLALSGSILQGVMKNPLADPSIRHKQRSWTFRYRNTCNISPVAEFCAHSRIRGSNACSGDNIPSGMEGRHRPHKDCAFGRCGI